VKRDDDFFPPDSFIHQTQKKDLFFMKESTKKKLQPIKFLLFPSAGGTRDRTKEKKETLH
jgi:hypothetical protein